MGKPEAKVEMYFVDRAEQEGVFERKVEWISRNGCPDRYGSCLGRTAFIEFKSEYGELAAHQKTEIQRMRDAGTKVLVVCSRPEVELAIAWFIHHKPLPAHMTSFDTPRPRFDA